MTVFEKLPSGKFHTKGRFTTLSGDQKALVIGGQSVKIEVIIPTFYVDEDAESASKVLAHISNVEINSPDGFTVWWGLSCNPSITWEIVGKEEVVLTKAAGRC
jgi:hypothetical protein